MLFISLLNFPDGMFNINIRTIITLAWERNTKLLMNLAVRPSKKKPNVGLFIAILAYHLSGSQAA